MASSSISNTTPCCLSLLCILTLSFYTAQARVATVDGFVTKINSPTNFDIGALHVVVNEKTQCATETLRSNVELMVQKHGIFAGHNFFGLQEESDPDSRISVPCSELLPIIGLHINASGDVASPVGPLIAIRLTAYEVSVQQHFTDTRTNNVWEGGALLEEPPQVKATGQGWTGTMWLDGYPMIVKPNTKLLAAPSGALLTYRQFGLFSNPSWGTDTHQAPMAAFNASVFRPNTWAAYRGVGSPDGRYVGQDESGDIVRPGDRSSSSQNRRPILARIWLWPNRTGESERMYMAKLAPLVHDPDYVNHIAGSVGFQKNSRENSVKILADLWAQKYVSAVGESLLPTYQKALPELDETKIHFRFYIVQGESHGPNDQMTTMYSLVASQRDLQRGAWAFPDGVIILPDFMLARVQNEAQLASILSYAITTVVQKQGYIVHNSRPGSVWETYGNTSWALLPLSIAEKALRVGIRQMYLAGYDIREAPFAWAAAAGKPVVNPVMDPKYPNEDVPWETAYAFDYISQYYSDVDYSKLKKGEAEYQQFLDELRKADPEAFAKK